MRHLMIGGPRDGEWFDVPDDCHSLIPPTLNESVSAKLDQSAVKNADAIYRLHSLHEGDRTFHVLVWSEMRESVFEALIERYSPTAPPQ